MKYLIQYLIAVIILISCNNITKVYYEDGALKEEFVLESEKKNGFYKSYYKSGNLWIDGYFEDDKPNGKFTEFYENGNVKIVRNYEDGKLSGQRLFYLEDGSLVEYMEFENEKPNGNLFLMDSISGDTLEYSNFLEGRIRYSKVYDGDSLISYFIRTWPETNDPNSSNVCFNTYSPVSINLLLVVGNFTGDNYAIEDTLDVIEVRDSKICYDFETTNGPFQAHLMELDNTGEIVGGSLIDINLEDYFLPN